MAHKIKTCVDSDLLEYCFDKTTIKRSNKKNIKLVESHSKYSYGYVCYSFALENINEWINSCRQAFDFLEDQYEQINIKNAKKGDIISYHEIIDFKNEYGKPCKENSLHFAVIKKTRGTLKSTVIRSKWGGDGVFETSLYDVPDIYGNAIVIWRRK